jgi:hypothetical protein
MSNAQHSADLAMLNGKDRYYKFMKETPFDQPNSPILYCRLPGHQTSIPQPVEKKASSNFFLPNVNGIGI